MRARPTSRRPKRCRMGSALASTSPRAGAVTLSRRPGARVRRSILRSRRQQKLGPTTSSHFSCSLGAPRVRRGSSTKRTASLVTAACTTFSSLRGGAMLPVAVRLRKRISPHRPTGTTSSSASPHRRLDWGWSRPSRTPPSRRGSGRTPQRNRPWAFTAACRACLSG